MDEEILDFIRTVVGSVWSLELILFMRAHVGRGWTERQLAHELRGAERQASEVAAALVSAGLLARRSDGLVYAPISPGLDRLVGKLAAAYAERPVAVVNAIASSGP